MIAYLGCAAFAFIYISWLDMTNHERWSAIGVRANGFTFLQALGLSGAWILSLPLLIGPWAADAERVYAETIRRRSGL